MCAACSGIERSAFLVLGQQEATAGVGEWLSLWALMPITLNSPPEGMGTVTSKILGSETGKGEITPHRKNILPVHPEAPFVHTEWK